MDYRPFNIWISYTNNIYKKANIMLRERSPDTRIESTITCYTVDVYYWEGIIKAILSFGDEFIKR